MGQYWYPVNLDKREFIHPHRLATGLKLWEQVANHPGTGAALLVLCAAMPERRGGGDLDDGTEVARRTIGRWAGDRIALVGDYAGDTDLAPEHAASTIYALCTRAHYNAEDNGWTDVSEDVCAVLAGELDGEYSGDGWRRFESRWSGVRSGVEAR